MRRQAVGAMKIADLLHPKLRYKPHLLVWHDAYRVCGYLTYLVGCFRYCVYNTQVIFCGLVDEMA